MGIPNLYSFLQKHSSLALCDISMSCLYGKKLAIDISIYLYKFLKKDCLIENLFTLLALFRQYHIYPIFVFDGKPPLQKQKVILERKRQRRIAQMALESPWISKEEISFWKARSVHVKAEHIQDAKTLISLYGGMSIDAPADAETYCAYLTNHQYVWATLSEDMDVFLYGCPRVLRQLSLAKQSAVLYTTSLLLHSLGLSLTEFRTMILRTGHEEFPLSTDSPPFTLESCYSYFQTNGEFPLPLPCEEHIQSFDQQLTTLSVPFGFLSSMKTLNGPMLQCFLEKHGFFFLRDLKTYWL